MASSPAPKLHDRYAIRARLGQGRLAVVYQARDERLQRPVLVHLLRQELVGQETLRRRFLEEAQRGAQRSHPGLLEIYDSGDVAGRPFMITEDVLGEPLAEQIPLPPASALGVLRTIASAVALAQSQGSPHPPISSRNVWLLESGRAVLLENWRLSPQEGALDLAHYRAPERARGGPPSPATAVYALGILSWETLVGERPFTGATPDAIAQRQLREPLPSLIEANPRLFVPGLDRVINCAATSDPDSRYPAPVDFARALDLYVDQATAHTGRLAILPQPRAQRTVPGLNVFRRRSDTAVRPPPPPAVIHQAPSVPPRTTQPVPAPMPVDQSAKGQQMQRPGRWELRRRGCQRAIVKRTFQIALIVAFIYAIFLGVDYATGRVREVDPSNWVSGWVPRLPSFEFPELPWSDRISDLRDIAEGFGGRDTIMVKQPINLRAEPSREAQLLRELQPGTVLQRLGGPVDDQSGSTLRWIKVVVVEDGTEGWVANLTDFLEEQ